jgi:hypothetical protein
VEKGGFHAEVNALWGDGRHWGQTLYFAESEVTEEEDESVTGNCSSAVDAPLGLGNVRNSAKGSPSPKSGFQSFVRG